MTLNQYFYYSQVNKHIKVLEEAPLVILDGNIPQTTIDYILEVCQRLQKPGETTDFY